MNLSKTPSVLRISCGPLLPSITSALERKDCHPGSLAPHHDGAVPGRPRPLRRHQVARVRKRFSAAATAAGGILRAVIKGEAHLGITYLKYVGQYKGPIDYVRLNKYLADTNYMGVGKRATHPNAGKLYVEYICSPEGQKAMAGTGEFVLAPQVSPAIQGAADVAQRTIFMEEPTAEEFKKLREEMRQIFLTK